MFQRRLNGTQETSKLPDDTASVKSSSMQYASDHGVGYVQDLCGSSILDKMSSGPNSLHKQGHKEAWHPNRRHLEVWSSLKSSTFLICFLCNHTPYAQVAIPSGGAKALGARLGLAIFGRTQACKNHGESCFTMNALAHVTCWLTGLMDEKSSSLAAAAS